jgi:glutamine amidotransferase
MRAGKPWVAVVDYGLGNLFSVGQACRHVGMEFAITDRKAAVDDSWGIILPGVGAFGDAMAKLRELDLLDAIGRQAARGKPVVGICLGMQLMMDTSREFGLHQGLGLVPGEVLPLPRGPGRPAKVPQVGWNSISPPEGDTGRWGGTVLEGTRAGEYMYFVHSYFARPADPAHLLSVTEYGGEVFCSALQKDNCLAFQFHPERSGPAGLEVYQRVAGLVSRA